MLGTCFYEYLYYTDSDILLFLFLLTNGLIVSRFGEKCQLSALNVKKCKGTIFMSPLSHAMFMSPLNTTVYVPTRAEQGTVCDCLCPH